MLVCKHFAFVHMMKTGGRWVAEILENHSPKEWNMVYTGRIHDSVKEATLHVPSFVFIRNPWDWYVSLYFFYRQHWVDKTGGYILPKHKWQQAEIHYATMLEEAMPEHGFLKNSPRIICGKEFNHSQFSQQFDKIAGIDNDNITVLRYENLRSDLLSFLEKTTGMVPQGLRDAILNGAPTNTSRHKGYREYYSEEVRDLVAKHDARLIERFGYEF